MRDPEQVLQIVQAALDRPREASAWEGLRLKLIAGTGAFPSIDAGTLGRAIASRLKPGEPAAPQLAALHVDDLLCALACVAGDAAALAFLDTKVTPQVVSSLLRRGSDAERDELSQRLRIRLLVAAPPEAPRLSLYAARGPLPAFVRVVALNLLKREHERTPPGSAGPLDQLPDTDHWETRVLRVDQQRHFRLAFQRALATLTSRQRALLRLSLLDGLSIDDIAPMYAVNRSSVARWLAEARQTLEAQTRALLAELLQLQAAEVDRLLTSAVNGFELSLGRALRETLPPTS